MNSFSTTITPSFIDNCKENFHSDEKNIVSRNAVAFVGSLLATTNTDELNKVSHVFMNTIKKKNVKATDQGQSGRCWMFAGFNVVRHFLIKALDLDDFEFSETYLFFWDKFERSNTYLEWFIRNRLKPLSDKSIQYKLEDCLGDGGYWSFFVNLVSKYGVVPKSAMKETYQSEDSNAMNQVIVMHLKSCVNYFFKYKSKSDSILRKEKYKVLKTIYCILVKFLGEPPNKFSWSFITDAQENYSHIMPNLTPSKFTDISIPGIDFLNDMVILGHFPHKPLNTLYEFKNSSNIQGAENLKFLNLDIYHLSRYSYKTIENGIPVWFGADVTKEFHDYSAVLDDKLIDTDLVFGKPKKMSKKESLRLGLVSPCHAMVLTGMNLSKKGVVESWQVENSWGYWDYHVPGLDGFLYMSNSWFRKYVMEIVVPKKFLNRTHKKLLESAPTVCELWDPFCKSVIISGAPSFSRKRFRDGMESRSEKKIKL